MNITKILSLKKGREHPIKRDESGKSARRRCFEMFEDGYGLPEVIAAVNVRRTTVYKYHQQWLKDPHFENQIAYMKSLLDKDNPHRQETITQFAILMGVKDEQIEEILQQPYGLRRLLTNKFSFPAQRDQHFKRSMSLALGMFFDDLLTQNNMRFEDFSFAFEKWSKESQLIRAEENEEITHNNRRIEYIRYLLKVAEQSEEDGRPIRQELSAEERQAYINLGMKGMPRSYEKKYWAAIEMRMLEEGLAPEQAREQMYQETLATGDAEAAKKLRDFQNKVHPLKTAQPPPPATDSNQKPN